MLSLEELRKTDSGLADMSDEELTAFRADCYQLAQIGFEIWWSNKDDSKNPLGLSSSSPEEDKI